MDIKDNFEKELHNILGKKKKCECGKIIDRMDIAWNNGQTEYGTGHSTVMINCQKCGEEILYHMSWYPDIEDDEELLHVIEEGIIEQERFG